MKSGNFIPTDKNINYKIIIPQEEPKPETIKQEPCKFCGKTLREQMKGCGEITCYRQFLSKQETVEEVALNIIPDKSTAGWIDSFGATERIGFIKGAKWQAQRMYSEKEVYKLTLDALDLGMTIRQNQLNGYSDKSGKELHKEWFEQFKKK
jgi:hypothetical protein